MSSINAYTHALLVYLRPPISLLNPAFKALKTWVLKPNQGLLPTPSGPGEHDNIILVEFLQLIQSSKLNKRF